MSWIEALILGIIQGLTEFLPVSSSGHLEITKVLLGDTAVPEDSMLMTVVVHAATALSTIVVFRKDVVEILRGIFQWQWNAEMEFAIKIGISIIPAGIIGITLDKQIESLFGNQVVLVGAMLIVTALLLFIADMAKTTDKGVTYWNALVIGVAQAVAILPGISRSGATISSSVMLGIDRTKAARFSFLMVVPLILAKMVMDIYSGDVADSKLGAGVMITGFLAAFVSGIIACAWMIRLVKRAKLKYFAFYCLAAGIAAILLMTF